MSVERHIRENNGKKYAAVILSPCFGTGWSTWNTKDVAIDKRIVEWLIDNANIQSKNNKSIDDIDIEDLDYEAFEKYCHEIGYKNIFAPGFLRITFLPLKTIFRITEYDGAESIEIYHPGSYTVL